MIHIIRLVPWIIMVGVSIFCCALYVLPPLRLYLQYMAQNFDFAIQLETVQRLSLFEMPLLYTRGTLAWADNQDYINFILAAFYRLFQAPEAIIGLHSLAIFGVGIVILCQSRLVLWYRMALATFVWLSPILLHASQDIFHPESFATVFLILMFLAIRSGKVLFFWIFWLCAVICKEDIAFSVIALLVAEFLMQKNQRWISRSIAVAIPLTVLFPIVNLGIVLPWAKNMTSLWLCARELPTDVSLGHASPWFGNLTARMGTWDFYRSLWTWQNVRYVMLVAWPLICVARIRVVRWFVVLGPALMINVIGGYYLIQARFHYDHTTFAIITMALLDAASVGLLRKTSLILLVVLQAGTHFSSIYPKLSPMTYQFLEKNFWDISIDNRVKNLKRLTQLLPSDVTISADYVSTSYLIQGRRKVFMFPNPTVPKYFGLYGSCDGVNQRFVALSKPDLVIVRDDLQFDESEIGALKEPYILLSEHFKLPHFNIFLNTQTSNREAILSALGQLRQSQF